MRLHTWGAGRRGGRCGPANWALGIGVLAVASTAGAATLIRESFGLNGGIRYDAAGNPVVVFPNLELNGLRAEFPNTAAEVWTGPSGHHVQAWQFSFSSLDPNEPPSPYEPNGENGTVTVCLDCGSPASPAALLAFSTPAGLHRVSVDVLPGGLPATGSVVGFTTSLGALNNNFARFGQAWLMLFGDNTVNPRRWELHTDGTSGPTVSGTTPFTSGWFRLELTYDPATQTVGAAINGVPTPTLHYAVTGVAGVGIEGWGTANNFAVETVARLGDLNCDGAVNFGDINPFVLALSDPAGYHQQFPGCDIANGDINGDGHVDFGDINPFVALLSGA